MPVASIQLTHSFISPKLIGQIQVFPLLGNQYGSKWEIFPPALSFEPSSPQLSTLLQLVLRSNLYDCPSRSYRSYIRVCLSMSFKVCKQDAWISPLLSYGPGHRQYRWTEHVDVDNAYKTQQCNTS